MFSPVATKIHVTTRIYFRPKAANKTFQEFVQRFSDLVIQATGTDPTAITSPVTIVLFIRCISNKEIKKQVVEAKTI